MTNPAYERVRRRRRARDGRTAQACYEATVRRCANLRAAGYTVLSIASCAWTRVAGQSTSVRSFARSWSLGDQTVIQVSFFLFCFFSD